MKRSILTPRDKEFLTHAFMGTAGVIIVPILAVVYVCLLPYLAIAAFCLCFYRVMEGIK